MPKLKAAPKPASPRAAITPPASGDVISSAWGQAVSAALNDMNMGEQRESSDLTLTTAYQKLWGIGGSVTNTVPETLYIVAQFEFLITTVGVGMLSGAVYVDGVARPGSANWQSSDTAPATQIVQFHCITALAPGTHTFDIEAKKSLSGGAASAKATNSRMMYQRIKV